MSNRKTLQREILVRYARGNQSFNPASDPGFEMLQQQQDVRIACKQAQDNNMACFDYQGWPAVLDNQTNVILYYYKGYANFGSEIREAKK